MGKYPKQYPVAAIAVAEPVVRSAVGSRLVHEGLTWKTHRYLLSSQELKQIRLRFAPGVKEGELLNFVGLVFSKTSPQTHYEFVSDGFLLGLGGNETARTIVVNELPPCFHGYEHAWRRESHGAALEAVRSLLMWRFADLREPSNSVRWSIGEQDGVPLIHGRLYDWIKDIGAFSYCRTRNVIEFIYAAVPELHGEWKAEGLMLVPAYHVGYNGRDRFTTLSLQPVPPA